MTETRKHKKKLKERGITLIALVITIIVLLILAGVTLSALTGDSGILNNAESAKKNTNLANAKEQIELSVQGALLEKVSETGELIITYVNLENELDNIVGEGKYEIEPKEEADSWTVTVGEYEAIVYKNGTIENVKILPTAQGTTPWLPDGFSKVKGTDLTNGLTITNATGLQNYVWIEVPNNIKQTITVDSTEKTISLTEAKTDEEIALILKAYAGDYRKGSSRQSCEWKDEWYDGCGLTYDQYQTSYSRMLKSVKEYGGFWLAQYEAGIASEEEGAITITKANYAKDQYPYNFINCSKAQRIASADSTSNYTSSLPFGIQWDLVCKFLEVKKAKTYPEIATTSTWGNYYNTLYTPSSSARYAEWQVAEEVLSAFKSVSEESYSKTQANYILLTTGAIEATTVNIDASPMNIYDFAGNVSEFTLEHATEDTSFPCSCRGGNYYYSNNYSAAYRDDNGSATGNDLYGFRSTLY